MNLKKLIILAIMLKSNLSLSKTIEDEIYIKNNIHKNISLEISVGKSRLKTNEYVYDDYYRNIQVSKINWKSNDIKIFRSNLNIILPYDLILDIGFFSNLNKTKKGILNDYDKVPNYSAVFNKLEEKTGFAVEELDNEIIKKAIGDAHKNMDWNFWSYNNAVLENFYGIHFDIQKLFMKNDRIKLGLGLGYEQDKSKWYGIGGYGSYSNKKVEFSNINKIIEFNNKYKIPYIYLQGIIKFTNKLKLSAKYKKSFWASVDNTDYHSLRAIKYFDKSSKKNGKYNSLDLKLKYKINDNLSIFSLYNINRFSPHRTDMRAFDFTSNSFFDEQDKNYKDRIKNKSGFDSKNYSFNFGIKYDF